MTGASKKGVTAYTIHALDPGDEFVHTTWETQELPRIGEDLMLPEDQVDGEWKDWQEMRVVEIQRYPDLVEVWLGGTDGWEPGSVAKLFINADRFRGVNRETRRTQ